MASIPPFQSTPADKIVPAVNDVRTAFHMQKTKPLEFRKTQLRKLYWGYESALS